MLLAERDAVQASGGRLFATQNGAALCLCHPSQPNQELAYRLKQDLPSVYTWPDE